MRFYKAAVLLLLTLFSCVAYGTLVFQINPTYLELGPHQKMTALSFISKQSTEVGTFQLKLARFEQGKKEVGSFKKEPQLLISPPIFSTKPHKSQIIRVARMGVPPGEIERYDYILAHQIKVKDIDTHQENKEHQQRSSVKILLNIKIPILIDPIKIIRQGELRVKKINNHQLRIFFHNTGTVHCQTTYLILHGAAGLVRKSRFEHLILARKSLSWKVELPKDLHMKDLVKVVLKSSFASGDMSYTGQVVRKPSPQK